MDGKLGNMARRSLLNQRPVKRTSKPNDDSIITTTNRQEIENELAKLDGTYCPNANDKYQLLLKRDTLLAKLRTKSTNLKQATQFLGNCPDMCPEKERYMRQTGNLLHPFECNADGTVNHLLAVKDYARSAADQIEPLPHELRPPDVLQKTMDYLIMKTNPSMSRAELVQWYDFLWSRTRSIRKEITQQTLTNKVAVELVEKCARFHIYASFCMSQLGTKDFDERMNSENLSKCLQTLRLLYDDLARKSIYCDSEPEFRAYDILMNLADSNALSVMHTYRENVRESQVCNVARQLACSYQTDNYVQFFRLIRQKTTFLQACLCRSYFNQIRSKVMHIMVKVVRPSNFPISKFTELLAFDNDKDTLAFMKGLELFVDGDGMIHLGENYQIYGEIDDEKTNFGCLIISSKLNGSLQELIAGGLCSNPTFPTPVNSFVSDYFGKVPTSSSVPKLSSIPAFSLPKAQMFPSQKVSTFPSTSVTSFPPAPIPPINRQQAKPAERTIQQAPEVAQPSFKSLFNDIQATRADDFNRLPVFDPQKQQDNPVPTFVPKAPERATIEVPADFVETARTRLIDDVLNFCTDDFVWLAAYEARMQHEEHKQEVQQKETERVIKQLPEISQQCAQRLYKDVMGFCIDDFIWLAAQKTRAVEQKVDKMLEKHNLRIVRPYAQKWLSNARFRLFIEHLPHLNPNSSKRASLLPIDGAPQAKRSKIFTPMKFSNGS